MPFQQKETVPENLSSVISVFYYFEYIDCKGNGSSFPVVGDWKAVMKPDTQ